MERERTETISVVSMEEAFSNIKNKEEFSSLLEGFLLSLNELSEEYISGLNSLFSTYKDVAAITGLSVIVGGCLAKDKSNDLCVLGIMGSNPEEALRRLKLSIKSVMNRIGKGGVR